MASCRCPERDSDRWWNPNCARSRSGKHENDFGALGGGCVRSLRLALTPEWLVAAKSRSSDGGRLVALARRQGLGWARTGAEISGLGAKLLWHSRNGDQPFG